MPKQRRPHISGIYAITNADGTVYVGQAQDIHRRWSDHKKHLRTGVMENIHLQRAWDRDGAEAFTWSILEECPIESLDERETYWIAALPSVYNFLRFAGTLRGVTRSDEARANISKGRKGIKRPYTSPEHRQHLSEALKGRKPSDATLEASAVVRRGKPLSEEHRRKVGDGLRGKKRPPRTPEHIRKLSEAAKERNANPEYRAKIAQTLRERKIAPSAEARKKAAEAVKDAQRYFSPEHRAKLSAAARARHARNRTSKQMPKRLYNQQSLWD